MLSIKQIIITDSNKIAVINTVLLSANGSGTQQIYNDAILSKFAPAIFKKNLSFLLIGLHVALSIVSIVLLDLARQ